MNNQYPTRKLRLADFENFVIVADSHSMRWEFYERELNRQLGELKNRPRVEVLEWSDVIARNGNIESLVADNALVRVESPARDFELIAKLMQVGQSELNEPVSDWTCDRRGWIASPKRMYLGLSRMLNRLEAAVGRLPGCQMISSMTDTLTLFDKNKTSQKLREADLPTPDWIQPKSTQQAYEYLEANLGSTYFLKLANGSSASGIVKLGFGEDRIGLTTVLEIDGKFYNTFRVHEVFGQQLTSIFDFIIGEGATLQVGVPKTNLGTDTFDVRVVVNRGEIIGTIFRASQFPMTNLHLGGYRADANACLRVIPKRQWLDGLDACESAAKFFDMEVVGIDICFHRETFEPFIIEINSFGDFFPNWKTEAGKTIYEMEVEKLLKG